MGMREKLIELLYGGELEAEAMCIKQTDCDKCPNANIGCQNVVVADHLIASGVTIPVRCKDCKHWCYEYDDVGLCVTDVPDIDGVQRLADDFCSYGERNNLC